MAQPIFKSFIGAALLGASSLALAVPMDGGISFVASPGSDFSFDNQSFSFDSNGTNALVNDLNGQFGDYFSSGDAATFFDFTYNPAASVEGTTVWEAVSTKNAGSTIQFTLESLTKADFASGTGSLNSAIIEGTGTLSDGDKYVSAAWNISANEADGTFSWSSSTSAQKPRPVPEPGTLGMLGLALAGLGVKYRRKFAA